MGTGVISSVRQDSSGLPVFANVIMGDMRLVGIKAQGSWVKCLSGSSRCEETNRLPPWVHAIGQLLQAVSPDMASLALYPPKGSLKGPLPKPILATPRVRPGTHKGKKSYAAGSSPRRPSWRSRPAPHCEHATSQKSEVTATPGTKSSITKTPGPRAT